tara:strand:+ start:818 stop:1570 length:753 start_codon:yes stop_codon:yes gene_type:complete
MSLSEIIIYSGENRPFDIAYLNPFSFHFEIEMNKRQNTLDLSDGSANAIWQYSIDYFYKNKIRISFNLLIDELVIDKEERDAKKANGLGYSFRLSKNLINNNSSAITIFLSSIAIGTHALRHDVGSNNFINRNYPLGWPGGSDSKQFSFGINYFNKNNLIINTEYKKYSVGYESITKEPYTPYQYFSNYLQDSFPSGEIKHINMISFNMKYKYTGKYEFSLCIDHGNYNVTRKKENQLKLLLAYNFSHKY